MLSASTPTERAAARRSSTPTGGESSANPSCLLCRTGTQVCALPLGDVIEIMRLVPIQAVAGAPTYVRGLAVIRGAPVPVVDISVVLAEHAGQPERLVSVRAGTRRIALAVDTVIGIRAIPATEELPSLLGDATRNVLDAIGMLDTDLLYFLNTARIVPAEVFDRLIGEWNPA